MFPNTAGVSVHSDESVTQLHMDWRLNILLLRTSSYEYIKTSRHIQTKKCIEIIQYVVTNPLVVSVVLIHISFFTYRDLPLCKFNADILIEFEKVTVNVSHPI